MRPDCNWPLIPHPPYGEEALSASPDHSARCDSIATRLPNSRLSEDSAKQMPMITAQFSKNKNKGCRSVIRRVCQGQRSFFWLLAFAASAWAIPTLAQESPYIVTYDHYLEEPGSLEVEYFSTFGTQRGGNDFHAFWAEFEYGATAWWTTELYLDGQTTFGDSTIFTGFRFENRFRVLQREHFINPVLYVEYEQTNGADKILKEVEGHDVEADFAVPNATARQDHNHELEFKLLLSKTFKGWNVAENTIATKNLTGGDPWEFGYAMGASRPLGLKASAKRCSLCRQNFIAGVEMYGGLGDRHSFGLHDTSHYVAPVMPWNLPSDCTLPLSTGFGLNDDSHRFL